VEVWQTSSLRRLRLGEEKKKKKPQGKDIMVCRIPYRATIIKELFQKKKQKRFSTCPVLALHFEIFNGKRFVLLK